MKRVLLRNLSILLFLACYSFVSAERKWPMFRHDAFRSGYTASNILPDSLSLKWKVQIETRYPIHTSPAVVNGIAYITGGKNFYSINLADGSILWKFPLDIRTGLGEGIGTPEISDNGILISKSELPASKSEVRSWCLDFTGKIRWANSSSISGAIKDKMVLVNDGSISALSLLDGKLIWRRPGAVVTHPVVVNDVVFVGGMGGLLYAIDSKNGELIWWKDILERNITYIAATEQRLYLSSFGSRRIVSLNVKDGEVIWKYERGIESNPAIAGNRLFAASKGMVFCLDANTGKLLWERRVGDASDLKGSPNYISDIAATEKFLFFGISDGLIFCLDSETGKILWKFGTGGTTSAPAIVDGHVIVIGQEGTKIKGEKNLFCFYDGDIPIKRDFFTTIQGKVVDDDSRPLGRASVKVAGTNTTTDPQGKYIVKLKNYSGNTLVQAWVRDKKGWGHWFGEGVAFVNPGDTVKIDVKTSFEDIRP